jgi:hypothetical protein
MCFAFDFLRHQSDSRSRYVRLLCNAVKGVSSNVVFVQHVMKQKPENTINAGGVETVGCFSC